MAIYDSNNDKFFTTRDTALAAWLYSQGFDLLGVEREDSASSFHFDNTTQALRESVRLFQAGKAEGNILIFYRAYKKMLRHAKGHI